MAGEYPLDHETVSAVGLAMGAWITGASDNGHAPMVVIGMDTRESGLWMASEIAGGLRAHGVDAEFAGVTTTPGVAYLARTGPFAAGVMISASHNPYRDNGIKIIGHSGYKLPDQTEEALEKEIFRARANGAVSEPVELRVDGHLDDAYADYLASTVPDGLSGFDIVVDCANGGSWELAPALLERLGAKVHAIGATPDGRNINLDCGSLHLENLRAEVLRRGAQFGIAFDGDADRALFVSGSGRIIDGDAVMLINARDLHSQGRLRDKSGRPVVIATVMSNLGLELALERDGIALVRTPVGDRYVLEEMLRTGAILGGEQSGHVIFLEFSTTGDGMLTALRVMDAVRRSGRTLDELTADLEVFPQLLVNVRVKNKRPIEELQAVQAAIRDTEAEFAGAGRVLVRFSGTEPLARVMVEGRSHAQVHAAAHRIADHLRAELGAE